MNDRHAVTPLYTPAQAAVVDRVLDEEAAVRQHLVVSLSGAHAYGFPSPDSDFDLKAIHVEPSARLLGLVPPPLHATRMEFIDDVEIDYSSNEVGGVLAGILQGNGNYVERVLGALTLRGSAEHDELRRLGERALSRRVYRHYHGFARAQLADFDAAAAPTVKKLLYVLRTAFTGIHLLITGKLVTDLGVLAGQYGLAAVDELIARKRAGERVVLDDGDARRRWREQAVRVLDDLDAALARSPLPVTPPDDGALEAWLLDVRRRHW